MCSLKMQSDRVTGEWQKAICYLQLCDDGHTFFSSDGACFNHAVILATKIQNL